MRKIAQRDVRRNTSRPPKTPALDAWHRRYAIDGRQTFDRLWRVACWEAAALECRAKGLPQQEAYAREMAAATAAGLDWWVQRDPESWRKRQPDHGAASEQAEAEREAAWDRFRHEYRHGGRTRGAA